MAPQQDVNERIELTSEQEELLRRSAASVMNGALEWLAHFPDKFYSMGYMLAIMKLFADPGLKKSELALFLEVNAKLSRSTADRIIREANKADIFEVKDNEESVGLSISLTPKYYNAAVTFIGERLLKLIDRAVSPEPDDFFAKDEVVKSVVEATQEAVE
jgi:hypothetical protein